MKKEDLDALSGLYESVYSPESCEYLTEAPQGDLGYRIGRGLSGALRDLPSALQGQLTGTMNPARVRQAKRGENLSRLVTTGKLDAPRPGKPPVKPAAKPGSGSSSTMTALNSPGTQSRFVQDRAATPARPASSPASRPSSSPASRPSSSPASRPASSSPAASTAKVAPSKPSAPAGQTGDKAKDMETWAKANPKLAAAAAERERTRGTSATTNPLMKDFKDRLPAPKAPSPTTSATAFAKTAPSLGSSTTPIQSAGSATASKPTTNQTATAFSSPSLMSRPTPSTSPIKKPGSVMSSFEWGTKATLKDVADAYKAVYEAKKKDQDQDQDGDNDFADVQIARMIASGMSKAEAIAAVKNKPYNEEVEILDEAEGSYGATPKAYSAASKTKMTAKRKPFLKKMLSRTNPANRTSPYDSPRKGMSDDDRERARAGSKHGVGTRQDHDYPSEGPGGVTKSPKKLRKQKAMGEFGEAYDIDEATRMRKELGKEGEIETRKELAARSKAYNRSGSVDRTIAAAERAADWSRDEKKAKALRGLASSRRGSVRDKPRAGMKGYAANVSGEDKELQSSRQKAMSAGTLTPKEKKQLGEEYIAYEIVASYLLENNFAETIDDANVIIENMSEVWLDEILTEKKWIAGAIKKPGAFTKKAKAHGMSTSEFAAYVDKHPEKFPTKTERQANLAQTLRKFK